MKTFLRLFVLLLAGYALSTFAQAQGRLSPDDQRDFDKYYTKWVNDSRKNDTEGIAKDVGGMQEIMSRNHIPADVPFDQIASTGGAYPVRSYRGRLSAEEQREFDKYYTKWVNDTRKNDRDDIAKDVRHMQEIMAKQNIPADVPFDQIASAGRDSSDSGGSGPVWQGRLSADEQREFDRSYASWLDDTRRNDRENIDRDMRRMQDIMARNNIPASVPFDRIASPDAARH